jgi:hypothetical protein
MLTNTKRTIAGVTAAALVLTAVGTTPGFAASASKQGPAMQQADVEVSAARRHRHRGVPPAAALGAFAAIAGTIASVAAAQRYRDDPYRYGYYGGPYPGYYGGPYAVEPGYGYYNYAPAYRHRVWPGQW